jgi:hypothetical protein
MGKLHAARYCVDAYAGAPAGKNPGSVEIKRSTRIRSDQQEMRGDQPGSGKINKK